MGLRTFAHHPTSPSFPETVCARPGCPRPAARRPRGRDFRPRAVRRPEADTCGIVSLAARRPPVSACAGPARDGRAWRFDRRCSWRRAAWPEARPPCSSRPWRWGSPARAGTRSPAWSRRRRGRGPRAPGRESGTPTGTGAGPAGGVGCAHCRAVGTLPCHCRSFRSDVVGSAEGQAGQARGRILLRMWPRGWLRSGAPSTPLPSPGRLACPRGSFGGRRTVVPGTGWRAGQSEVVAFRPGRRVGPVCRLSAWFPSLSSGALGLDDGLLTPSLPNS